MKKHLVGLGLLLSMLCSPLGLSGAPLPTINQTEKNGDGVVYRDDNVRFTVVTDGLIRLEYAPDGNFVDDKSFVAVNRKFPANSAKVSDKGSKVTITTPKMSLIYKKGSGKFTADNLTIKSAKGMKPFTWHPGVEQKENLSGTTRTLDRWDGDMIQKRDDDGNWQGTKGELEPGLLARDGWTLIDDSKNFLFDNDPNWEWVKERKTSPDSQDWYFMAYGNDYKQALADFATLAGDIPLPPRYAFGYWWSRWWAYSEHEFRQLIDDFADYQIPLEVLVIDMDWHYTDEAHGGWTGWTWNRRLFPEPERFLNYLRDKDMRVTLNLHPASGVKKFESAYPQIAKDMGVDPVTEVDIPWVSSDKKFMRSMFDNILKPMEDDGVTFWWLDWQQDPYDSKIDSLSNTWWINYAFFSRMQNEREGRPMLYHRWGGLGNHRYQIGFSGDNYVTWKSLDFLPYFTSTASNVLYGFWSHDLGGHYMAPGDTAINPELYVRSLQYGAYSPIMRTHSNKNARLNKEPWNFDRLTLNAVRAAIQRRYEMAPYIYTMARKSHDTAIALCRPMYYDYPDAEEAYEMKNQYMFGDNMIVMPVTAPSIDGYADVEVWLPDGQWYEEATGTLLDGGKTYTRRFAINETPVYVKAGSIIPLHARKEKTLRHNTAPFMLTVYPGESGHFTIYEDNGDDKNYHTQFATTDVKSERDGNRLVITIDPRKGSYKGMPESREISVNALATLPPLSVKVDGKNVNFIYNPEQLATIVNLPEEAATKARTVEFNFPDNSVIADGTIGNMKRFVETFGELKNHYARLQVTEEFGPMSIIYEAIGYAPEKTTALLDSFRTSFADIDRIAAEQDMSDSAREWFIKSLGLPYTAPEKPAE